MLAINFIDTHYSFKSFIVFLLCFCVKDAEDGLGAVHGAEIHVNRKSAQRRAMFTKICTYSLLVWLWFDLILPKSNI